MQSKREGRIDSQFRGKQEVGEVEKPETSRSGRASTPNVRNKCRDSSLSGWSGYSTIVQCSNDGKIVDKGVQNVLWIPSAAWYLFEYYHQL